MTSRERLLTVLAGKVPDCVPVAPDFSNMIPARLTGKPFWDLYLFNDPPIWEAYIQCARHFDIESLMDGFFPMAFPDDPPQDPTYERFIVRRDAERIVVQGSRKENGRRVWDSTVGVYYVADSPTRRVPPEKLGLPPVPKRFEPLEGVKPVDTGPAGLKRVMEMLGDQGLVGLSCGAGTLALDYAEGVFDYYDNPKKYEHFAEERVLKVERRMASILALETRPDFIAVGGSGSLVFQTPEILRKLALPAVKRATEIAHKAGIPTHVHSCGREKELVKIMAEETYLTVIDPLEAPPMGDCDLAEIKRCYGDRLVLKGNLHTTDVMLRGTPEAVARASRKAIDDAAEGGRFILSTGDQCGRDTPDENLRVMIQTARTYGKYR